MLALALASPSPFFRPGGDHEPAAGRALSRRARVPCARHPQGLALTEGARQAARRSFRLAGLGFPGCWAPPGGQRERWRRPQPAPAARGVRLAREDGDGAGWAGGTLRDGRPPQRAEAAPAAARGGRPTVRGALRRGGVGGSYP